MQFLRRTKAKRIQKTNKLFPNPLTWKYKSLVKCVICCLWSLNSSFIVPEMRSASPRLQIVADLISYSDTDTDADADADADASTATAAWAGGGGPFSLPRFYHEDARYLDRRGRHLGVRRRRGLRRRRRWRRRWRRRRRFWCPPGSRRRATCRSGRSRFERHHWRSDHRWLWWGFVWTSFLRTAFASFASGFSICWSAGTSENAIFAFDVFTTTMVFEKFWNNKKRPLNLPSHNLYVRRWMSMAFFPLFLLLAQEDKFLCGHSFGGI